MSVAVWPGKMSGEGVMTVTEVGFCRFFLRGDGNSCFEHTSVLFFIKSLLPVLTATTTWHLLFLGFPLEPHC